MLFYGGKLGVNLFVLISGYFLVSGGFRPKKAVKIWMDVTIYSVGITAAFVATGTEIGLKEIMQSVFPIIYGIWWFPTAYFVMLLTSGYINKLIYSLLQKELDRLILLLAFICSVIPTLFNVKMADSNVIWFLLYLIAARIKLYPVKDFINKYSLLAGAAVYLILLLSCGVFDYLGTKSAVRNICNLFYRNGNGYNAVLLGCGFHRIQKY